MDQQLISPGTDIDEPPHPDTSTTWRSSVSTVQKYFYAVPKEEWNQIVRRNCSDLYRIPAPAGN